MTWREISQKEMARNQAAKDKNFRCACGGHVTDSLHQKRVAPDLVVRVDAAQRKTEARTKMEATMIKKGYRVQRNVTCVSLVIKHVRKYKDESQPEILSFLKRLCLNGIQ